MSEELTYGLVYVAIGFAVAVWLSSIHGAPVDLEDYMVSGFMTVVTMVFWPLLGGALIVCAVGVAIAWLGRFLRWRLRHNGRRTQWWQWQ